MNHAELEAFVLVARHTTFSQAATDLSLTQPAISKRIASLENSVGSSLFDRIGKSVVLTPAGRRLLPLAQQILLQINDAQRSIRNRASAAEGELHLATSHHVGLHRLAPVLRRFNQDFPRVTLAMRFEDSEAAHELVRAAEVELAVVTLNPEGDAELRTQMLWHDPLVFAVAKDHPLARQTRLDLAQLAGEACVLPGLATYTGRIAQQLFADAKLKLQPAMSTNYLETIGMLVGTGMGWSLLPRSMLNPSLVALDVPIKLARQLGVVTHPGRTLSNAASAFLLTLERFADAP